MNSRSYGGTLVKSDHKIVITRFNFSDAHLVFPKQKPKMHFDITTLVSNPAAKMHYNKTLNDILTDSPVNPNPEEELNSFVGILGLTRNLYSSYLFSETVLTPDYWFYFN